MGMHMGRRDRKDNNNHWLADGVLLLRKPSKSPVFQSIWTDSVRIHFQGLPICYMAIVKR